MDDLFGKAPEHAPVGPKRGPQGGKHYVRPMGYGGIPGTGPAGMHCRDCEHYVSRQGNTRTYPKCGLNRARWTSGRGSDILASSPACSRFKEAMDGGVIAGTNRTTSGGIGQP